MPSNLKLNSFTRDGRPTPTTAVDWGGGADAGGTDAGRRAVIAELLQIVRMGACCGMLKWLLLLERCACDNREHNRRLRRRRGHGNLTRALEGGSRFCPPPIFPGYLKKRRRGAPPFLAYLPIIQ